MRRNVIVLFALALVVGVTSLAAAQQPGQPPAGGQRPAPPAGAPQSGGMQHEMHHPGGAMPGGGMQGGGMPMMCNMMGGGMMGQGMMGGMMGGGMPMMGMMGGDKMDPKTMGQMLEMRGEMMRAVAEVMIKHGKTMQGAKP